MNWLNLYIRLLHSFQSSHSNSRVHNLSSSEDRIKKNPKTTSTTNKNKQTNKPTPFICDTFKFSARTTTSASKAVSILQLILGSHPEVADFDFVWFL